MFRARRADPEVRPFSFDRVLAHEGEQEERIRDLERLRQEAHAEGYAQGEREGFEAGLRKAEEVVLRLQSLITGLEKSREELYGRLEREILDLVFRIAEKVLRAEIQRKPSARTAILAAGLQRLKESEPLLVRVSPGDYEIVKDVLPALKDQSGIQGKVTLQEDPGISDGGCVIESNECELDGRIEACLAAIEEALRGT